MYMKSNIQIYYPSLTHRQQLKNDFTSQVYSTPPFMHSNPLTTVRKWFFAQKCEIFVDFRIHEICINSYDVSLRPVNILRKRARFK